MSKNKTPDKKNLIPGSKIPIAILIDYVKEGYSISEFLSSYPWVKRESVKRAFDEIKSREFVLHNAL